MNINILDKFSYAVVAIGDCGLRINWVKKFINFGYKLSALIHQFRIISTTSNINDGTVVFANTVFQSEAKIGKGVILNTSCNIDHYSVINDGAHIFPGVNFSENVNIGTFSWIRLGSIIIEGITIGENVILGAGSIVIKNFSSGLNIAGFFSKKINKY